jgi:UDP-glucuronate decarboxylase
MLNTEIKNYGLVKHTRIRSLVTGGAGFVGSHLCDRLIKLGHQVICVDNLFSGQKSNIAHLLNHPDFEFIRHDIIQSLNIQVDEIYHLACPASPVFYQKDPIYTIQTGVIGTMNMLELAKNIQAKFLITSTSEIYGDPKEHPQKESYWGNVNCVGIRSCYDESKRMAETLCMEYSKKYNLEIHISRLFNTYGPRMLENDGRVVSNFIVQALKGKDCTIYGDGTQTRSFCYVSDTVDALVKFMNSTDIGPMNIGNPGEYTIKQLADKIFTSINPDNDYKINYMQIPSDDPIKRKPDITKAKGILLWEPIIGLDEGLKITIEDFKHRI